MNRHIISPNATTAEIMQQYGVSRTTAWRAKRRGWLAVDYHKKNDNICQFFIAHYFVILKYARYGKNEDFLDFFLEKMRRKKRLPMPEDEAEKYIKTCFKYHRWAYFEARKHRKIIEYPPQ